MEAIQTLKKHLHRPITDRVYLGATLIGLTALVIFSPALLPRKVVTSKQTKDAIATNQQYTQALRQEQTQLLENQRLMIKELLIQKEKQAYIMECQKKIIQQLQMDHKPNPWEHATSADD